LEEIDEAKMKGKKTVTICKLMNPSPWIVFHSDIVIKHIAELEKLLKEAL